MEIMRIGEAFTAFIRPKDGANVGLLHTPQGMVWIDTAGSPIEIQALLSAVDAHSEEARLVVNTHFHTDHTWGNQVFSCPILAHRACPVRMKSELEGEWSQAALHSELVELQRTDPVKAGTFSAVLEHLMIKIPDQVFDERYDGELGGVKYEVIHVGGHTPDASIVWLPGESILYASDLVFQGRYPYIFDADVPRWVAALDKLLSFNARVIIPGHGIPCGEEEILALRDYLQQTWELVGRHIRQGHSEEKTAADPAFPVFPGEKYERLHQANIRYVYEKLVG
jgi:glyoxylase-like metal-dependent hydrolase (beta-lactamase superfamily II)